MRSLLVVLLALTAAGGAAWLLLGDRDGGATSDGGGGTPTRDGVRPPPDEGGDLVGPAPRQGVVSPRDRDLVADPDAPAWHTNLLRFSVPAGERLTGRLLLEAIEKHLYVRARDLDTLDAIRKLDLGMEVPSEMPMSAVVGIFERAGYQVYVQPPRFVVRKAKHEEIDTRLPR